MGLHMVLMLPILIPYNWISQRARCFYYLFCVLTIGALTSMAKLFYHEARPFWVSDDVSAYACSNQYGNPSGHCFTTVGVVLTIWFDYNSVALSSTDTWFRQGYSRLCFLGWGLVFAGAIVYSRLFLGVHSLNQVLFGSLLGIWFAITAHFLIR